MNRTRLILLLAACAACLCAVSAAPENAPADEAALRALVRAYPAHLCGDGGPNTVRWRDGTEMVFDDGVQKGNHEELLNRASLKDQMSMPYPAGWPPNPPEPNCDPGRARNTAFFLKMYGGTAEAVEANLADVEWLDGARLRFTRVNDADAALRRVRDEIARLPEEARRLVSRPAGTFVWRSIAGTSRPSMHSFGAAADFELPKGLHRYWKWDTAPGAVPVYPDAVPGSDPLGLIVRAFERHGFIWGGKWFHYDTMHFEYRPELLPPETP